VVNPIEGAAAGGLSTRVPGNVHRCTMAKHCPSAVGRAPKTRVELMGPVVAEDFSSHLDAVRSGDSAAFAQLFQRINPQLLNFLRGLAPDYAEDAASETWIGVLKGLPKFEGGEQAFRAWVFTIARRRVIDWQRRHVPVPVEALDPDDHTATDPDPSEAAEQAYLTRRALALIGSLPHDQAEAVLLRVVAGFDVSETARILQRSPGSVRVLCHRGLKTLAASVSTPTLEEV
jgi:RNA polymerase sigma-70 factor, ECF subfamily